MKLKGFIIVYFLIASVVGDFVFPDEYADREEKNSEIIYPPAFKSRMEAAIGGIPDVPLAEAPMVKKSVYELGAGVPSSSGSSAGAQSNTFSFGGGFGGSPGFGSGSGSSAGANSFSLGGGGHDMMYPGNSGSSSGAHSGSFSMGGMVPGMMFPGSGSSAGANSESFSLGGGGGHGMFPGGSGSGSSSGAQSGSFSVGGDGGGHGMFPAGSGSGSSAGANSGTFSLGGGGAHGMFPGGSGSGSSAGANSGSFSVGGDGGGHGMFPAGSSSGSSAGANSGSFSLGGGGGHGMFPDGSGSGSSAGANSGSFSLGGGAGHGMFPASSGSGSSSGAQSGSFSLGGDGGGHEMFPAGSGSGSSSGAQSGSFSLGGEGAHGMFPAGFNSGSSSGAQSGSFSSGDGAGHDMFPIGSGSQSGAQSGSFSLGGGSGVGMFPAGSGSESGANSFSFGGGLGAHPDATGTGSASGAKSENMVYGLPGSYPGNTGSGSSAGSHSFSFGAGVPGMMTYPGSSGSGGSPGSYFYDPGYTPEHGYGSHYPSATGGVKTAPVTNYNSPMSYNVPSSGHLAGHSICPNKPKQPINAALKCTAMNCKATCLSNYQFPNGDTSLYISCIDEEWVIKDLEWTEIPSCEPICLPQCQNKGICVAPGECSCPDNFKGPQCQYENKVCVAKPPLVKNAKRMCSSSSCTVECMKGYRFPDGTSAANIICKDGQWVPMRSELAAIPDCQPTCDPACENGGQCLSHNVCQCPPEFRGPLCQYNVDVCSPKRMNFNGGYKCSGTDSTFSCSIICPEGVEFSFLPALQYVCEYATGKFMPENIPQCVSDDEFEIVKSGASSHTYYTKSNHTSHGTKTVKKPRVEEEEAEYDEYDEHITIRHKKKRVKSILGVSNLEFDDDTDFSEVQIPGLYSIYADQDVNVVHKLPKAAICMTWNGNKVKTFDGLTYNAPLYCSHTLLQDRVDGAFSIVLRACPFTAQQPCPHALDIFLQNLKYTFVNDNGVVKLFSTEKQLPIPAQLSGIRVTMAGSQVKINLDAVKVVVVWNKKKLVTINVSPTSWNRTSGLCGTLDSTIDNDFTTKDGNILKSAATFKESWRAPSLDTDPACSMEHKEAMLEKVCAPNIKVRAAKVCKKLLNNLALSNCVKMFDKDSLIASCISDFCNCDNVVNSEQCACHSITVIANDCLFQGISMSQGWRDLEICPVPCTDGRVYKACGPSFEPSCGSAVESELEGGCQEGCFCPTGTIQHNSKCIQPELCPCELRGKIFPPGKQITRDCNTCTCEHGNWKCTDVTCGSRCSAIGDPHYVTFDGKHFDFMGKCSYYLLVTDNITVEAENVACPGSISQSMGIPSSAAVSMPSCTKSVTVNFNSGGRHLSIKLKQGNQVLIDGLEVNALPKKLFDDMVKIRQPSSLITSVEFENGIKIFWDGITRVYIDAPPSFRGRTKGLCGTFTGTILDDFLTPEGDIESAVEPFADKWRTRESCQFMADSPVLAHPCQLNVENKEKAERYCSKIKSKLFDDCHWSVDPIPFYDDCVYDVCACKGDFGACMCPILAAYSAECARKGVAVDWRYSVNECAIQCPPGQVYEQCGDACVRTCSDLHTDSVCKSTCVEGCRCPLGEVLGENNECIPVASCSCSYQGLIFNAGYKEVRPGHSSLELCTCMGAKWNCRQASPDDSEKFPPAASLKNKCNAAQNEEFTTCEPLEVATCKNMHLYHDKTSPAECRPGCVCKYGYVFDVSLKKCVLPKDCSCHHGGRSYNDGDKIQEDCNECLCQSGKWQCTTRPCALTCSAWGDSHFDTFDGRAFDFQGVCDYVLSKGVLPGGEAFSITLQNVLCGSAGVTCSKSIKISITGAHVETITLNADLPIPGVKRDIDNEISNIKTGASTGSKVVIHRAGIFIVVEVPGLGLQVKWDRGTRVYVKLENKWKGRVRGLCGNYNGDANDDLQTPSGGIETSPALFGHAWKLQDYCAVPTDPIDACATYPQRKTWSQRKCGVLKSEAFRACHSEVPVEPFLKRCVFDTCACDQGGDCECLCTAIAAYAHACSMRGIPIKWRTPELCPMQCDPYCSSYSSCVSACPVDTCDTILIQGKEQRMCIADSCVEGCKIKPCPEGYIYKNDTFTECVPESVCRPICLEMAGVVYYEGDIINSDKCHTCRCTRGKSVCSGEPCKVDLKAAEKPACLQGWSAWVNKDTPDTGVKTKTKPTGLKIGDREPLPDLNQLVTANNSAAYCNEKFITAIECRTVYTHQSPKVTGEDVECSLEKGLVCNGPCHDYEIRVLCDCSEPSTIRPGYLPPFPPHIPIHQTTPLPLECDMSVPSVEYPGDCHSFRQCTPTGYGSEYVVKTCGSSMMYNPRNMVCDWPASVIEIKPECGKAKPEEIKLRPDARYEATTTAPPGISNILLGAPEEMLVPCELFVPKPHREYPGDCYKFKHCGPSPKGGFAFFVKTCGPDMMFNPESMVCDWPAAVKAIKPECNVYDRPPAEAITPTRASPYASPYALTTPSGKKPPISGFACPPGYVFSECALPCGLACDYYGKMLIKSGQCKASSNKCIEGCVESDSLLTCPPGYLWRDNAGCVKKEDCLCMSKAGLIVKPGEVFSEDKCTVCQCIDNVYICNDMDCEPDPESARLLEDAFRVVNKTTTKKPPSGSSGLLGQYGHRVTTISPIITKSFDTPPEKCEPIRFIPIIEGEHPLPDTAFTASTVLGQYYKPHYARLHSKPTIESSGAWSPDKDDLNQFLQVEFLHPIPVYGVVLKGSPTFNSFVTSYHVMYSLNNVTFHIVSDDSNKPVVFSGPIDPRNPVQHAFKKPIEAKFVRIKPLTWNENIAIRVELLGCGKEIITTTTPLPTPPGIYAPGVTPKSAPLIEEEIEPLCDEPMGLDNGKLAPNQVKVSSSKPLKLKTNKKLKSFDLLKLTSPKGWSPIINSPNEFVLFDFLEPRNLTGVKTQGGTDGFVTGYNIQYSPDNLVWNTVQQLDGTPKMFIANFDSDTPKVNYFKYPIKAQFLKLIPKKWTNAIEMKVEPLGCFKPYPQVIKQVNVTTTPEPDVEHECGLCPGVLPPPMPVAGICKCVLPMFWNGRECIKRSECPCMVGPQAYNVGSQYELEDCSECICVIGGVPQCRPQQCPPCQPGLRPVKSSKCHCLCEPCPEGTTMCVSSGACIDDALWCDGFQDCPDDEINCKRDVPKITAEQHQQTSIVKQCPDPVCPPGFKAKITEKPAPRKMSPMFQQQSSYTPVKTKLKSSYKKTKTRSSWDQQTLAVPTKTKSAPLEECIEFVCLPIKPEGTVAIRDFKCPEPVCPEGYEIVLDMYKPTNPYECAKYTCEPCPQNDAVCNVTGRSINTFDNMEFKFDICSHVLARELANDNWNIVLRKNCSAGNFICNKELEINDKANDILITFFQDFSVNIDGYIYTVPQVQRSAQFKNLFSISKVGKTIVFISPIHGFWLTFDSSGNVDLGVSAKIIENVDGLCGYYNGKKEDDKRMPNGEQSTSTKEFGDSWYVNQIAKEFCQPHACPSNLQNAAWDMCNAIRKETFAPCMTAVDIEMFVSKCIETACECLKENLGDVPITESVKDLSATKSCKCFVLENFVMECLEAKETVNLDNWRIVESCEATCPPPLVHKECFRRLCEPSCDNLDSDTCPFVPGKCFSGCYCPEGTIRKGELCVPITECRDCICDGFGKSKYVTYDRNNFTFDGNCTYLLSRDVKLSEVHTFQVFVTLAPCESGKPAPKSLSEKMKLFTQPKQKSGSCTQSLHILYGPHIIHIQRSLLDKKLLDILVDGIKIKSMPHREKWIQVSALDGHGIQIILPESQVELIGYFEDLSFSLRVPSLKYGAKMEGLCGDCDREPANDFRPNPATVSKLPPFAHKDPINTFALSWQSDEPKLGLNETECTPVEEIETDCIPLPPESDPCLKLFDEELFGKCHMIVDPIMYVSACQQDMCKAGPFQEGACESLSAYARECSRNGICLDWRRPKLCPFECPSFLTYEPCGCAETCDTVKAKLVKATKTTKTSPLKDVCSGPKTEGCFCPKGKILRNGKCTLERECTPCDNLGHYPGDKWYPDVCTDCECDSEAKTICSKKKCSIEGIKCDKGFEAEKISKKEECCPKYICVPIPTPPPPKVVCPPETLLPACGPGQIAKLEKDIVGCPRYICECKPKSECEPLPKFTLPLNPGMKIVNDTTGCCATAKLVCDKTKCTPKPKTCATEFYELIQVDYKGSKEDYCCDEFKCIPPKNKCIVVMDGKKHVKAIGEKWPTSDPCLKKECNVDSNGVPLEKEIIKKCTEKCDVGYELQIPKGECCGKCVQTKCVINKEVYAPGQVWFEKGNNCTQYSCVKADNLYYISKTEETCPNITGCALSLQYKIGCCTFCKPEPRSLTNESSVCAPVKRLLASTKKLIKMVKTGHGQCVNNDVISELAECKGGCNSGTRFNTKTAEQDKFCTCCTVQQAKDLKVAMTCEDGFTFDKFISTPIKCTCTPCQHEPMSAPYTATKTKSAPFVKGG